jgi:hypothetical protein
MVCTPYEYNSGDLIEKNKMGVALVGIGERTGAYRV